MKIFLKKSIKTCLILDKFPCQKIHKNKKDEWSFQKDFLAEINGVNSMVLLFLLAPILDYMSGGKSKRKLSKNMPIDRHPSARCLSLLSRKKNWQLLEDAIMRSFNRIMKKRRRQRVRLLFSSAQLLKNKGVQDFWNWKIWFMEVWVLIYYWT